jgi:hypothetical protein
MHLTPSGTKYSVIQSCGFSRRIFEAALDHVQSNMDELTSADREQPPTWQEVHGAWEETCRRFGVSAFRFSVRRSAFGVQRSSGQKRVGVRRIGVSAYRRIGASACRAPGSWLLAPGSWLLAGPHPSSKPPWRPVDKSRIRKKKNFNLLNYGRYSKHGRSSAGSLVRSFFFN